VKFLIHSDFIRYLTIQDRTNDQKWSRELNPWSRFNHIEGPFLQDHYHRGSDCAHGVGSPVRLFDDPFDLQNVVRPFSSSATTSPSISVAMIKGYQGDELWTAMNPSGKRQIVCWIRLSTNRRATNKGIVAPGLRPGEGGANPTVALHPRWSQALLTKLGSM